MKRKIIGYILLATLACVALFGFAACDNGSGYDDSALVDRIEALEDQIAQQGETIENQQDTIDEQSQTIENQAAAITALQTSVTELQTAKTNLEEQIASLEDDNTANKTEITTLKTKVEALEAANAKFQQQIDALDTSSDTFAEGLAELTSNYNSLTTSVQNATHIERVVVKEEEIKQENLLEHCSLYKSMSEGKFVISCRVEYSTLLFHYQLLTCKVSANYNQQTYNVNVYLSRADANESTPSLNGGTATDILVDNVDNVTLSLEEIVLYRFN